MTTCDKVIAWRTTGAVVGAAAGRTAGVPGKRNWGAAPACLESGWERDGFPLCTWRMGPRARARVSRRLRRRLRAASDSLAGEARAPCSWTASSALGAAITAVAAINAQN